MDIGNFFENMFSSLALPLILFGISVTVLQFCSKKSKKPIEYEGRSPTDVTHSERSSYRKKASISKSTSKSPNSPSPSLSRKSEKRRRRSKETDDDEKAERRKKQKHRQPRSSEKKKSKEEHKKSERKKSVERSDELCVMSTQPSHPSSSDTDSVGTARIEIVTFPLAECPAPKKLKVRSKENVEVEQIAIKGKIPSREALKKPSREAVRVPSREAVRKPSKEAFTETPVLKIKESRECENLKNSAPTASEINGN